MNDKLLPKLRKAVIKVVKDAAKPGGTLDRNEFRHSQARAGASKIMGFGEDGLEEKKWKRIVKEMVQEAIDEISTVEESDGASGSQSPQRPHKEPKKSANKKRRKQSTPSSSPSPSMSASPSPEPTSRPKGKKRTKHKRDSSEDAGTEGDEEEERDVSGDEEHKKEEHAASESEMSSVYDVAPSRKKRKGAGDTGDDSKKSKTTKRKKKDPNEGLSMDEAKVADLKRIVVACGVRKQWSKEFADYPTPKDQARHLEQLLLQLGMKGKPSMGKAKTLKEQRELAAELNDVRQFEAARGVSASERKSKQRKRTDTDDEDDDPRPQSALAAVMDFFDDESD